MEPSTLELKVPRRTLVRSTSNRRQHSLLLPLPPSRGAQRTWGRARTPPLFRHRYSSQLGLLHIASDLFSSITVHYDELQSFSASTPPFPAFRSFSRGASASSSRSEHGFSVKFYELPDKVHRSATYAVLCKLNRGSESGSSLLEILLPHYEG